MSGGFPEGVQSPIIFVRTIVKVIQAFSNESKIKDVGLHRPAQVLHVLCDRPIILL